jgi:hemolysin activation/secretion protein
MWINICKSTSEKLLIPCTGLFCLIFNSVAVAELPISETQGSREQGAGEQGAFINHPSSFRSPITPLLQPTESNFVLAQSTPGAIPPGTIEPTQPTPPLPETLPAPQPTPDLELPQPTPSEPSPAIEAKVQVKRVEVLGSRSFSETELAEVVKPFINKEATFEQLLEIRTAVTKLYTSKGYTTSGAFLPPQDVSDGIIKVQVVEGELERIEVQGLNRLHNNYVRSRLEAAAKPPVNIRRLEAALQLLQQNPLLSRVQAELTAGTAPGRSVLILNLKEAQPFSTALILDNRDSPSVGSLRGTAAISHQNLLGLGDRLNAEVGITEGVRSYNLDYEIPLNARDGTLSLRYNNGNSRIVEQPFTPLDIEGKTQTYSLGLRQPLIRTPTTEFALSLAGDLRRSRTFLFDDEPFSFTEGPEDGESKVSVVRFSQDWVNRSPSSVLAARSQFSFGLGILGATVNDTGIDGRFFSWLGQFQWVQALGNDTTLVASTAAQFTGDSLLPLEQFSIGGVDTVRGYRTNQRVGDNGVVGSLEVRIPVIRSDRFGLLQVAPFIDAGTIWSNGDEAIAGSSTLVSTGIGLRWQLGSRFFARLDWGIPLVSIEQPGDSLQDNGIFFSLRVQPF